MKRILILIFGLLPFLKATAQVEISTSQLVGTKWERVAPISKWEKTRAVFSESRYSDSSYNELLKNSVFRSLEYYISSKKPSLDKFNRACVGKEQKGKYLVVYYPKIDKVDYFTIESFTEDELILFHKALPDAIPAIDVLIKFKRIN